MTLKDAFNRISRHFRHYEERPGQIVMAEAIEKAIINKDHIIIEAGTGIGKSIAYLVPFIQRLEMGDRVIVSTYTKALQRQLVEKDIPFLIHALERNIRFALCVGGENYLCLRRLFQVRNLGLFEQEDAKGLEEILIWHIKSSNGLKSDLPREPSSRLWQQVRREADLCPGRRCQYFERCFYQRARALEKDAHILVTNHHLFFAHIASGCKILPSFDSVIFDEAHELEDVATNYLGLEISNYRLKYLLDSILSPKQKGLIARIKGISEENFCCISGMIQRAREAGEDFFASILERVKDSPLRIRRPEFAENTLSGPVLDIAALLDEIKEGIVDEDNILEIKAHSDRCLLFVHQLNCILNQALEEHVYWAELNNKKVRLVATPLAISTTMKAEVFDNIQPVIMTSATLSTNGNFDFFRERIGIGGCNVLKINSPFNYNENVILYLPKGISEPSKRQGEDTWNTFMEDAIARIKEILKVTGGRTMILFTNYLFLRRAGEALGFTDGLNLIIQGESDSYKLLKAFKNRPDSVLLGTYTFWQGVDLPGKALECVIITKLPFQMPDDPVVAARIERLLREGKDPFYHYQVPKAVLLFRQGFGRLIRRKTDRGVVAILDPRIQTRSYGARFMNSIPRCRVTDSLGEVERFLISKNIPKSSHG